VDYGKAVKWYRMAAEQGSADAQFALGVMYGNGDGVPQDYSEAVKWWRKAAEQGDVDAMRNLGIFYFKGKGVPQDHVQSYFWSSLAASRGSGGKYNNASNTRDRSAKLLPPEKLAEARRMTREWEKSHPRK
jgi:TPR repeat protein